MCRDGILNDLEQLLGSVHAPDKELMEKLDHQAREALERPRNPHGRVHFDEDTFSGVDIHLKKSSFVQRRVQQGKKTLWGKKLFVSACVVLGTSLKFEPQKRRWVGKSGEVNVNKDNASEAVR